MNKNRDHLVGQLTNVGGTLCTVGSRVSTTKAHVFSRSVPKITQAWLAEQLIFKYQIFVAKKHQKNHVFFLKSNSEETKELYPLNML